MTEQTTTITTRLTCARLRDWVREARPGARLPIGSGFSARDAYPSHELREYTMELAAMGLLTPHITRPEKHAMPLYIVQRTRRPVPAGVKL